jgi:hypothetical protein
MRTNVFAISCRFSSASVSTVMESSDNAQYFSNLVDDLMKIEKSFEYFLDGDSKDHRRISVYQANCNSAGGLQLQLCTVAKQLH